MRRLVLLLVLALLATACGGSAETEEAAPPAATGPGSEVSGESLDGERISLADYRGKRVLLNVWSSW